MTILEQAQRELQNIYDDLKVWDTLYSECFERRTQNMVRKALSTLKTAMPMVDEAAEEK